MTSGLRRDRDDVIRYFELGPNGRRLMKAGEFGKKKGN
jgi:hypothetical protein